jgi:hypothetical protein
VDSNSLPLYRIWLAGIVRVISVPPRWLQTAIKRNYAAGEHTVPVSAKPNKEVRNHAPPRLPVLDYRISFSY